MAAHLRRRDFSSVELVSATLDRIELRNPQLNAYVTVAFDEALEQAARCDRALARGEKVGPLHGVPFSAKDLIFTKGMRTTGGSKLYENFVPEFDDVAVERLRSAGSILLGKTNLAEFGYGGFTHNLLFGPTKNPLNLELTPGGSSGGASAAIAAGLGPLALGTDGGGSIRTPAAFCGLVGFKPTFGAVPLFPSARSSHFPGFSGWESVEHLGPITRTVEDAILVFESLRGVHPQDRHSINPLSDTRLNRRPLRVGWSSDLGYATVDRQVVRAFESVIRTIDENLDWNLESKAPGFADPAEGFWPLIAAETDVVGLRGLQAEQRVSLSSYLEEALALDFSLEEIREAHFIRQDVFVKLSAYFTEFDLLLTPTSAVPAFGNQELEPKEIDGRAVHAMAWTAFTFPFNLSGLPAISVPCATSADGKQIGLQIVGPRLHDDQVLSAALELQSLFQWDLEALKLDPDLP